MMTDKELMQRLRTDAEFNPWLKVAAEWQKTDCDHFVLDEHAVEDYKKKLAKDSKEKEKRKKKLHLDLLPQPFVGTPEAGIWLMLKNPGYSEWDEYDDHKGTVRKQNELREWESADEEQQMFQRRRELIFKQYKFALQGNERFYVLDDSFRTRRNGVGGCEGAYRWYERQIFPDDGLIQNMNPGMTPDQYAGWCSNNLFVLDYFPYHSEKFYNAGADLLKQDYWDALVEYGLDNEKLLVFWGSKILNRVKKNQRFKAKYEKAAAKGRIAILRGQKAVFCDWNFVFATDKCGTRVKVFVK